MSRVANSTPCRCGARDFPHRRDRLCAIHDADRSAWDKDDSDWQREELLSFDRTEAAAINASRSASIGGSL